MDAVAIQGSVNIAENQPEYLPLPVLFQDIECQRADGEGTYQAPSMTTAWKPTPEELTCLLNGGHVFLRILGREHPPIMLWAE